MKYKTLAILLIFVFVLGVTDLGDVLVKASTIINFTQGTYDFTLRGASDCEKKAKVDLVIGKEIKNHN